jgi:hypothetical protein
LGFSPDKTFGVRYLLGYRKPVASKGAAPYNTATIPKFCSNISSWVIVEGRRGPEPQLVKKNTPSSTFLLPINLLLTTRVPCSSSLLAKEQTIYIKTLADILKYIPTDCSIDVLLWSAHVDEGVVQVTKAIEKV